MAFSSVFENGIARVSIASARRPWFVLGLVAILSAAALGGIAQVEFMNDLVDILPRGNPNTEAAQNVSEHFPGHHSYTAIYVEVDESKWDAANARLPNRVSDPQRANITDEVYIRGLEEMCAFMKSVAPKEVNVFCLAYNTHVKLVNYTNTAIPGIAPEPDERAFAMPGTDPEGEFRYNINWQTVWASASREVQAQANSDWRSTRPIFIFEPAEGVDELPYIETGRFVNGFIDQYRAWVKTEGQWDVFNTSALGYWDTKMSVDAHQTDLTKEDMSYLGPIVMAFIVITFLVAFRSGKPLIASSLALLVSVLWTYGLMGYLHIPLNTLNLAIIPLVLGVGIDYGIHMVSEYLEHRAEGATDEESFRLAGSRAGFAMFLATITTALGLAIMAFSPSTLMAQVGALSALAITFSFLLSISFIPACLTVLGTRGLGSNYRPSQTMANLARVVGRNKAPVLILLVVVTSVFAYNMQFLKNETFGNPALNFPEGDPIRTWQEEASSAFFGTSTPFESNWVTLQGDLTDPAAHAYIRELQKRLAVHPSIRSDSVTSIINLVTQWQAIKDGTPLAIPAIIQESNEEGSTYPKTHAEMKQVLDEMYASPYATYPSLFINRDLGITVILVDIEAGDDYETAKYVWEEIFGIIGQPDLEAMKPAHLQVALGGYTAYSYLFITYEMPWVTIIGYVSFILVALPVLFFTRSVKATLAVSALVGVTSVWWLGILPLLGIGLSVTLMLPLVFIMSIGSDYAVHLVWGMEKVKDANRVWGTVGRAIFASAITTLGSFALFTPMRNLMMRSSMIATAIAIAMIFIVTILVIPLFYAPAPESDAVAPQEEAVVAVRR